MLPGRIPGDHGARGWNGAGEEELNQGPGREAGPAALGWELLSPTQSPRPLVWGHSLEGTQEGGGGAQITQNKAHEATEFLKGKNKKPSIT